jgi:preprotein translocase subunit Sec61beta
MAKDKKGSGFQSAAGLIRYFDAEDETALKIPPLAVIAMCVISVVLVYLFGWLYPVN